MTIDTMLDEVIRREGGFSHLPQDNGGATKFGITQKTLAFYRKAAVTVDDVKNLTESEAKAIYANLYYSSTNIIKLPDPLDDLIFDFAVNSGPQRAIMALQECLGIIPDGVCGTLTISAVYAADLRTIINKVVAWRIMMYARIVKKDPSQLIFLAGWLSRTLSFLI